ncbi:MAG: hypothetical protein JW779_10635 [Candidatus Thorarchaeota archaeon]|nr:hypothetical protein [Candidatus Thorarchaeota archaeon]
MVKEMSDEIQCCDWCGKPKDGPCIFNLYGGHYCSRGCLMADSAVWSMVSSIIILALTIEFERLRKIEYQLHNAWFIPILS